MEKRPFSELGLSPEVLKAVDKMGFEEASPIQTAVIPLLLSGRDVVGQSATGSGKTAAFAIPAIERIDAAKRCVQALILCPTRELAVQVAEEVGKLAHFKKGIQEVPIYGGQSYERQFRALESGVQIVIGTPGRVLDHMERGTLRLDNLKMLALDEADRMLDLGFRDDIARILEATPPSRQLLFFSATMPGAIQDLIQQHSHDPEWVRIESVAQNAPLVEQVYFEIDRRHKVELLTRLIDLHDFRYGIIFCSTKIMVDDLDELLHSRGYSVDRLHGDISQAQRDRVMSKFRQRGFEFLIATDVAARGLDVDDLEVVFNFDLPNDAEDYTHRIGRTGRAGRSGMAFTFVAGREIYKLQSMVRQARLRIRRDNPPTINQVEEARENAFVSRIRSVLQSDGFRRQDRLIDGLLEEGFSSTDIASALIHLLQGGQPAPKQADSQSPKTEYKAPVQPAAAAASQREERPAEPAPERVAPPARPAAPREAAPSEAPAEAPSAAPRADREPSPKAAARPAKAEREGHFKRPTRTGEAGYRTLVLNVGASQAISVGEVVGKIAGVTRLPASIIGAIEVREAETLVDIRDEQAELVRDKLTGVRMKGIKLVVRDAGA